MFNIMYSYKVTPKFFDDELKKKSLILDWRKYISCLNLYKVYAIKISCYLSCKASVWFMCV
jgi:hypothetical protein